MARSKKQQEKKMMGAFEHVLGHELTEKDRPRMKPFTSAKGPAPAKSLSSSSSGKGPSDSKKELDSSKPCEVNLNEKLPDSDSVVKWADEAVPNLCPAQITIINYHACL